MALAKQQQDTMEVEIEGPMQKRKLNIDGVLKEIDVVKKQKIEETRVLGKLIPQHLGSQQPPSGPMSIFSWNCRGLGNPWIAGDPK